MNRRTRMLADLDRDIAEHIERETQDNIARGMSPEEARYAAVRKFGNVTRVKEEVREVWNSMWFDQMLADIRVGLRMLRTSPGFTAVAVLTLALGIGANTAIFSVVNAVLLRPLAYKDSRSLVNVWGKFVKDNLPQCWLSEPEYWDVVQQNEPFSETGAYALGGRANLTRADAEPVQVSEASATASIFSMLGVTPILGRNFGPDEDQPGHAHFALLSYGLWQGQFAGDPSIATKPIQLNGETYIVLGVLPKDFALGGKEDLWVPLGLDRVKPGDRGSHYLLVIARLKPGEGSAQATTTLARLADDLHLKYPGNYGHGKEKTWDLYTVPMKEQLVRPLRPALLVLLGAVALVLLIACANVANLLLARASARERELGIRAALGAGRSRLMRQLLTESLLLALAGGLLGLVFANLGISALRALVPANTPRVGEVHLDLAVLAFTFGVSLVTGLLFGLAPSWHVSRTDLRETLNEAGRGTSAAGRNRRLRAALVVSELALAALLLVGATLLIRSFERLLEVSPGFQTQHLVTMELSLPEKSYADGAPVQDFFAQLMARVKALPAVEAAGAISEMPLTDSYESGSVFFEDTSIPGLVRLPEVGNFPLMEIDQHAATQGYFQAMQIPLVRGRMFTEGDNADAPLVAVVDSNFAHRFWPDRDALGQHVAIDTVPNLKPAMPRWRTIVGIVGHVKHYGLGVEGREQIYVPHGQPEFGTFAPRDMTLAIRTPLEPASITSAVREQVLAMDKNLPLYHIATMEQLVSTSVAQPRLNLSLLAAFAALALALAAVGVYGVMAYAVTQRTHEFGIRVALGATRGDVLRLVFLEGGRLAALGLAVGLVAALIFTRLMAGLLFGVKPSDPVALTSAAVLLSAVALAACYIPARRATRVDPLVALRYE